MVPHLTRPLVPSPMYKVWQVFLWSSRSSAVAMWLVAAQTHDTNRESVSQQIALKYEAPPRLSLCVPGMLV